MTVENLQQFTKELAKKVTFNTENLYQHNIMIRFNDDNRRACASFINHDNTDYTKSLSKFIEYMKNTYSSSDNDAAVNLKNLLLCDGWYKNADNVWLIPKFLYYSTNANTVRVLGYKPNDASFTPNSLFVCSEYGSTYTITDNVTTVALNNALKPSYQEFTTNLTYNNNKIGDIKWTCYKYPLGDGKFRYEWKASGSGSFNITWAKWSSSVSWSYYVGLVVADFPTDYKGYTNIKNNLICNMHLEGIYANQMLSLEASRVTCYFERPDSGSNGTKTIRFTATADYIANS